MVNVLGESGYDKLLRGVSVSTGTQTPGVDRKERCDRKVFYIYLCIETKKTHPVRSFAFSL